MIDQLKDEYLKWAQRKLKLEKNDQFIEVVTPFVDMHNDYISLFFTEDKDGYKLTDDGYIINELEDLGVNVTRKGRKNLFFKKNLNIFGVSFDKATSELFIRFQNVNEFPEMQQRLTQCLIRVSDMLVSSRSKVISFFIEDVENYFLEKEVFFNDATSYVGKSGNSQTFDFVLPKSKRTKPKLIKAINQPTKSAYKEPLLSFLDVQESKSDHLFIVIANDAQQEIPDSFKSSLQNHDIDVLPWSNRDHWVSKLMTS